jgi:hypothetical protein
MWITIHPSFLYCSVTIQFLGLADLGSRSNRFSWTCRYTQQLSEMLAEKEHSFMNMYMKYVNIEKLLSSYLLNIVSEWLALMLHS